MTGPTQSIAGTEDRVDVYCRRFEAGLPIFNSKDSVQTPAEIGNHISYVKPVHTINVAPKTITSEERNTEGQ